VLAQKLLARASGAVLTVCLPGAPGAPAGALPNDFEKEEGFIKFSSTMLVLVW